MILLSSLLFFALLEIAVFDKNGDATVVCRLRLQYGRNKKSRNSRIV